MGRSRSRSRSRSPHRRGASGRDERRGDREGSRRDRRDERGDRERERDRERDRDRAYNRDDDDRRPTTGSHADRDVARAPSAPPEALPPPPPLPKLPRPAGAAALGDGPEQQALGSVPASGANGSGAPAAAAGPGRQEPLSLEELLKRKKQEAEALAKPKFLSKKEREALALERLATQRTGGGLAASTSTQVGDATNGGRLQSPSQQPARGDDRARQSDRYGRDDRRDRDRYGPGGGARDRDRDVREWDRDKGRGDPRDARGARDREPDKGRLDTREREKELELIKQQYLGLAPQKKRAVPPSERMKFHFDWGADEDTSKDLNPLYNNPHEATLLFGRGMRAGIDRREQKLKAAEFEADMLRKSRSAMGMATDTMESLAADAARAKAADIYEGADMRVEKHWTEKALEDMTERDWRIFREDFNISYKGSNTCLPMRNWLEGHFPEPIMRAIDKVGYKKPSPIQMAAIPLGLQQRDVIGIAETGSGKTAAFVIPMLTYIMRQPPMTDLNSADGPYAVVLAPTRELAQQIEDETIKIAQYTDFKTVSIVGGQSIEEQGAKLRKGCEIVIATPYRLLDCLEQHYAVLNQCHYIVLDEADRMIDLGFEPQVLGVMDAMPSSNLRPENEEDEKLGKASIYRTTYMFSATMPSAVERLARKYLRRPVVVTIGSAGRATDNVTQRILVLKDNEKAVRLEQELELVDEKRAIVFANTKEQCNKVHSKLESLGHRCAVLHSGRSQDQREEGIKGFREDKYNVLIATDVAGRGIDVPDVALVINYDMPHNIEAYTHRIGRTARAGKKGTAVTFLTMGDTEVFFDLKKFLEDSKATIPPELARHEASKLKPGSMEAANKRPGVVFAKK